MADDTPEAFSAPEVPNEGPEAPLPTLGRFSSLDAADRFLSMFRRGEEPAFVAPPRMVRLTRVPRGEPIPPAVRPIDVAEADRAADEEVRQTLESEAARRAAERAEEDEIREGARRDLELARMLADLGFARERRTRTFGALRARAGGFSAFKES